MVVLKISKFFEFNLSKIVEINEIILLDDIVDCRDDNLHYLLSVFLLKIIYKFVRTLQRLFYSDCSIYGDVYIIRCKYFW